MNKIGLIILLLTASCSICMHLNGKNLQSDVTIATIEALSATENIDVNCISVGSIDCPKSNSKVLYYF